MLGEGHYQLERTRNKFLIDLTFFNFITLLIILASFAIRTGRYDINIEGCNRINDKCGSGQIVTCTNTTYCSNLPTCPINKKIYIEDNTCTTNL